MPPAPRLGRVSTDFTPAGGSTFNRETSGAAVVPSRTTTLSPSRLTRERTPITPPNSTRVNSALAPILIDSGSRERPTSWASGAIGANTTAPAVAAATVVFRMRFVGEAPDISPDPCRTRPLIAVNRRSP